MLLFVDSEIAEVVDRWLWSEWSSVQMRSAPCPFCGVSAAHWLERRGANAKAMGSIPHRVNSICAFFAQQTKLADVPLTLPDLSNCYTDEHVADSLSTSSTEVFDTLVKLKAGKAPGKDSITPELLSKCASGIANSLSLLFNRSFSECRIPSDWKEALVVPIHKGGPRTIPTNYRPIALLSVVSKVLEKIVHRRLSMFLQPVLSCKQSGFRKQDSTEFQLTRLVQHWSTAMDRSQFVGVLFLDIKKAFDRVYLPGLIYKLQSAGVRGNALPIWLVQKLSSWL